MKKQSIYFLVIIILLVQTSCQQNNEEEDFFNNQITLLENNPRLYLSKIDSLYLHVHIFSLLFFSSLYKAFISSKSPAFPFASM